MTEQTATSTPAKTSALRGVNVMLMGPAGTGKTFAIGELVEAGVEVFYLGLEPGLESLLGFFTDRNKPVPPNLHWHMMEAPKASFTDMLKNATSINTMSLETLAKMQDPNRSKHNQFLQILETLNDFKDDRTGESFGCVDTWTPSRALVLDSLTGLGQAAMSLVVGGKPVRNQSDWGIAQQQVETILRMLTDNCPCHFVLLAHVERETDAVLGGIKIMASTLGKSLAPKLSPMFSDVILAVREGSKWTWDTASGQADVKTRSLAVGSGQPPSFKAIIQKWLSRGGVL